MPCKVRQPQSAWVNAAVGHSVPHVSSKVEVLRQPLCACLTGAALGTLPQLTAVDGRRAFVTLPNDPELVDILAKNGVDISVSEGDQQGNYVSLLGALLSLHAPAFPFPDVLSQCMLQAG